MMNKRGGMTGRIVRYKSLPLKRFRGEAARPEFRIMDHYEAKTAH